MFAGGQGTGDMWRKYSQMAPILTGPLPIFAHRRRPSYLSIFVAFHHLYLTILGAHLHPHLPIFVKTHHLHKRLHISKQDQWWPGCYKVCECLIQVDPSGRSWYCFDSHKLRDLTIYTCFIVRQASQEYSEHFNLIKALRKVMNICQYLYVYLYLYLYL